MNLEGGSSSAIPAHKADARPKERQVGTLGEREGACRRVPGRRRVSRSSARCLAVGVGERRTRSEVRDYLRPRPRQLLNAASVLDQRQDWMRGGVGADLPTGSLELLALFPGEALELMSVGSAEPALHAVPVERLRGRHEIRHDENGGSKSKSFEDRTCLEDGSEPVVERDHHTLSGAAARSPR